MKLLVLGATGMLGASLVPALRGAGHEVVTHGRSAAAQVAAELTDPGQASKVVASADPAVVINLVGLTDVDGCEARPQEGWRLNVRTAENVAGACAPTGAHLIHISTDQVYDGPGPHAEQEALPGNYYAQTKYAGELAVLPSGATVLRTNFFGASRHETRRSLTDWLYESLRGRRRVPVFTDVLFSPLSLATLCSIIERLALLRPSGVFNLGARDGMSKAHFAESFARAVGQPADLFVPGSVEQAALKAWRPKDMRMDSRRIEAILGHPLPVLAEEIALAAKDYRENA